MAIGDRIRIITEEEYRIMSPPRKPRGEKPATTIRYLKRQIENLEISLVRIQDAASDRENIIAGYDVQLSEAQDTERVLRSRVSDQAMHIGDLSARLRQKSERLAFLEGYYAKSQEVERETILSSSPLVAGHQPEAHARPSSGNQENLSAGRQRSQGPGVDQGQAGIGSRLGDPVWREHQHHIPYPEGGTVEHVEVTENGLSREGPRRGNISHFDSL